MRDLQWGNLVTRLPNYDISPWEEYCNCKYVVYIDGIEVSETYCSFSLLLTHIVHPLIVYCNEYKH